MKVVILLALAGFVAALVFHSSPEAFAAAVVFNPSTKNITANGDFQTPPVIVQGASGVSSVSLNISIPTGIIVDTGSLDGNGNLACVTQGSSVAGLFFSEWDAGSREIRISCSVNSGSTLEVVRSIDFSTGPSIEVGTLALSGSLNGGSVAAAFGSLTLLPPHEIAFDSGPSVNPTIVASGGSTYCSVDARDTQGHDVTYLWSDGGAGGVFTPYTNVANPTYTAAANRTGSDRAVTLSCRVRCAQNAAISVTRTVGLTVGSVPTKAVQVTSSPASAVSIVFSPSPDGSSLASPRATSVTLHYQEDAQGIQLTAPAQNGAAQPRWFDHWSLDGNAQPAGTRTVSFNMSGSDHAAEAVYDGLVGDLDSDGDVDKADADTVLRALFGETAETAGMDVDQDADVTLKDAKWILKHRYSGGS